MTYRTLMMGLLAWFSVGCGAANMDAAMPAAPVAEAMEVEAPPLEESLFSRDPRGTLSEGELQRVLDARLEVTFPARLGVVTLGHAFEAEYTASVGEQATIAQDLGKRLEASDHFTHVTDISTALPNQSGIEGLRTIAARYRLRYLLVCNLQTEEQRHLNNWAWLYPTGAGLFLAPGMTVGSQGYLQASLLDVSTGTVLFTIMEPFSTSSRFWLVGANRHQRQVDAQELAEVATELAKSVVSEMDQLQTWVKQENELRAASAAEEAAGAPREALDVAGTPAPALAP